MPARAEKMRQTKSAGSCCPSTRYHWLRRGQHTDRSAFWGSELSRCWRNFEEGALAGHREFAERGLAATGTTYDPSRNQFANRIFLASCSDVADAIQRDVHVGERT